MTSFEILRTGAQALLQDLGRPGLAAVGVTTSGAFDRAAHRQANSLVSNPAEAATIEVLLGGLLLRSRGTAIVALTGAECPLSVDGHPVPWGNSCQLRSGQILSLGTPPRGLRSYLAVNGGLAVPPVLGSRSTDLLSGLGPEPLVAGQLLLVGQPDGHPGPPRAQHWPGTAEPSTSPAWAAAQQPIRLPVLPGPRLDWIADPAAFLGEWRCSAQSNRIGVRLAGRQLTWAEHCRGTELPSEPLVRGAIQVPPGGEPVIFGPDHPTTGGYPVVAVLTEAANDQLAQCRPGSSIWLDPV